MSRRTRRSRERPPQTAAAAPATPPRISSSIVLISLALAGLVLAVFWPVHAFDFIAWDDPHYVFNNPHVITGLTLDNLKWAFTTSSPYFHPITWVSHMIDAQLFGAWPGGHHLMALSLHALSTILLFVFLYRTTGATGRSAFVAAIFAIHPMRVESVAWIAERKDVLPVLALMIALNAYVSYVRRPSVLRYLGVTVPFVLGMLAKPVLMTFPFALLLVDLWPLKRLGSGWPAIWRVGRARVVEKLPWLALSIALVFLNLAIQIQPLATLESVPLTQRLANALIHYTQYIGMMLWPAWLTPLHPVARVLPAWWALAGAFVLLAGLSVAAARSLSTRPYITAGWFWFLGTVIPMLGLMQAGDQGMADRFGYIPQIGLYVIIAWGVWDVLGAASTARRLLPVAAALVVILCAVTTREYLWNWRDSIALWQHAIAVTPDSHRAHANLADALATAKRMPEAEASYREAIRLAPEVADYHRYFGEMLARTGRLGEAIAEFDAVLKAKPNDARAYDALGLVLMRSGRMDEAIARLNAAIRLDPGLASAHANLGVALARKGETTAALAAYGDALRIDPAQAQTHSNRGALYLALGKMDEAVTEFTEAQRLEPFSSERLTNLGGALSRQGNATAANAAFDRALGLDPDNAEAYNGRGVLLLEQGKIPEALAAFTRALEIRPDLLHVYSNRGRAFAVSGNVAAAIRDFEQMLRLDPGNSAARAAVEALKKAK